MMGIYTLLFQLLFSVPYLFSETGPLFRLFTMEIIVLIFSVCFCAYFQGQEALIWVILDGNLFPIFSGTQPLFQLWLECIPLIFSICFSCSYIHGHSPYFSNDRNLFCSFSKCVFPYFQGQGPYFIYDGNMFCLYFAIIFRDRALISGILGGNLIPLFSWCIF